MSNQLNINPEMDKLVREHGLGHWSCVSPLDGKLWVRSDGESICFDYFWNNYLMSHYLIWLVNFDKNHPIGEDWQNPKQPTLVQKPFQYPCDGALYFTTNDKKQVLLTHFLNHHEKQVVGSMIGDKSGSKLIVNAADGKASLGYKGMDLIMFVWSNHE